MSPSWYGLRYPSWRDLEAFAEACEAVVVENGTPAPALLPQAEGGPMILLPAGRPALERHWNLAHELGHLVQHSGPVPRSRAKQEAQADRWAACALIPQARINAHMNASLDAFIGALSAHYGDVPLANCPERRLAAKIARIRLKALEVS